MIAVVEKREPYKALKEKGSGRMAHGRLMFGTTRLAAQSVFFLGPVAADGRAEWEKEERERGG